MTGKDLEVAVPAELAVQSSMTVDQLLEQSQLIQDAMKKAMRKGEHYGVVPGAKKPSLWKAGAEKLCVLFRLGDEYEIAEQYHDDGHYTVTAHCTLFHIPTGNKVATGIGLCTTREKRYAVRRDGSPNPNLPDVYNTILKMAQKRAKVAAVLNGTAASDVFTQDLEDMAKPERTTAPRASEDQLREMRSLMDTAQTLDGGEGWREDAVLRNASRRFGRQIRSLEDLTVSEAGQILHGAINWINDRLGVDDDDAEETDAEETPEGEIVSG